MTTQTPEPESPSVERTSVRADDPSASSLVAERGRAALAALLAVRSPCLAPLVRVAPQPDGVALTHLVPTGAVTVAELRRAAPLRAGHVLTVALAIVDALVALADAGLAHGGVRADNVLVAPDGSVLLGAAGLAWRRPPGDAAGPRVTDDVAAVGDLVRDLLGRASAPSPLVLAALRASDADPLLRPEPGELRTQLARCGRADPLLDLLRDGPERGPTASRAGDAPVASGPAVPSVRTRARSAPSPDPVTEDDGAGSRSGSPPPRARRSDAPPRPVAAARRPRRGRRRPAGPRALLLVSALALVALGALRVGARALAETPPAAAQPATARAGASTASPGAGPSDPAVTGAGPGLALDRGAPTAPDWTAVLAAADAGRQRAIVTGSVSALRDWVDPAGPAWPADAALAERVSALHARIDGGALVVLDVRPQAVGATRSVLLVRDRRDAYSVVTSEGTSRVPSRAPRWWRVTLVRAASTGAEDQAGWRVHDVAPVAAPTG